MPRLRLQMVVEEIKVEPQNPSGSPFEKGGVRPACSVMRDADRGGVPDSSTDCGKKGMEDALFRSLFVINFVVSLGFAMLDPFLSLYARDAGAVGFYLASVFSVYAVSKMVLAPIVGCWSDRVERRRFVLVGLGAYVCISLLYMCSLSVPLLILIRFLQGAAAAVFRPVATALLGDNTPKGKGGTVIGTFDISFYSALAIGPLLGGFIKKVFGMSGIFATLFAICSISLLFATFAIPDIKGKKYRRPEKSKLDYHFLRRNTLLMGLLGFIFARAAGIILFMIFMPLFMRAYFYLDAVQIGIVMASGTIITTLLLRPMGLLSDRVRRTKLVVTGGVMVALLTSCLPLASGFWCLLGMTIALGLCSAMSLPASGAMLIEEGNRCGMGLVFGLFNGSMNLGFVVAPFLGGMVMDRIGLDAVFYLAGALGVMGAFFFHACSSPQVKRIAQKGQAVSSVFSSNQ